MAGLLQTRSGPDAADVMPASVGHGNSGRLEGTEVLFHLYLALLFIEFVGVAEMVPVLKAMRFSTLLAWALAFFVVKRVGIDVVTGSIQGKLLAFFVCFTAASVFYALINTYALTAFRTHVDYFGLFATTLYLVDRPARVRKLCAMACAIVIALVALNTGRLLSSERVGSFTAGYFLGNGNDFAWGMNVLLPLTIFLAATRQGLLYRLLGCAGVLAAMFGIVGTQSRGAALALVASGLFYWAFVMKRKVLGVTVVAFAAAAIVALAPPGYFQRLGTIQHYEEDNSAMSRITVWLAATKMAVDYPLGVGASNFASVYGRYYVPSEGENLMTWAPAKWRSAHSVYFRLLGEYGVLGVIWLFTLLLTNWRHNLRSHRRLTSQQSPGLLPAEWPLLVNMSMVGYAVSGLFLGGITYPHLYLLSALTAGTVRQIAWLDSTVQPGMVDPGTSSAGRQLGTQPDGQVRQLESVKERADRIMASRRRAS